MPFFKKSYDDSYFDTFTDSSYFKKIGLRQKVKLIRSVKKSGKLLEIGCGKGELLNELKRFYSVWGIDISPSAIHFAQKLTGNSKRLKVLNLEKGNIKGKYDIIVAFDLFEHLKNPEKEIIKIKKCLRKGGFLILSVPNNYSLYGKIMTKWFNFIDKTHISTYPRKQWIEILERSGFTLDVRGHSLFGIIKSGISKYISFNLLIIARNKPFFKA